MDGNQGSSSPVNIKTANNENPFVRLYSRMSRLVRQKIVWTKTFDTIILLVITTNCVFIAMEDPQREEDDPMREMLMVSERVFTIIFIVEMVIKWIALGFFGSNKVDYVIDNDGASKEVIYVGYFLDGWNVLDFIIVCSSITSFFSSNANTSSIRILRVLRPLRTIAKIKELRILVETILNSLRGLADVMLLLCFLFIIFAIICVQLFSGTLRQRCYYDFNPHYTGEWWQNTNSSYTPNKYYFKLQGASNPNLDSTDCPYDDSLNLPFQPRQEDGSVPRCFVTDLDHTLTYYAITEKMQDHGLYADFLYKDEAGEVILCNKENKVSKQCTDREPIAHPDIDGVMMTSSLCLRNDDNPDNGVTNFDNIFTSILMVFIVITLEGWVDIMYKIQVVSHPTAALIFYLLCIVVAYFAMNLCIAVIEDVYSETVDNENDDDMTEEIAAFIKKHTPKPKKKYAGAEQKYISDVAAAFNPEELKNMDPVDKAASAHSLTVGSDGEGDYSLRKRQGSELIHGISFDNHKEDLKEMSSYAISLAKPTEELKVGQKSVGRIKSDPLEDAQSQLQQRQRLALKALAMVQSKPDEYFMKHRKQKFIMFNRMIAQNARFNEFVLFVIMLNTITLAIYWPTITSETENVLEILNYLFTLFFTIEMIIKLIGLGFNGYVADNWNVFDGLIVVVSVIETISSLATPSAEGGGAISALRAFRLLRVLRLLGQFESLRIILGTVITSLGDVSYLVLILLLFIFMFSTLGISLFSKPFNDYVVNNPDEDFPQGRWRFDDIYWTMITVFQVITADAWNQVMFDAKVATGWMSVLYFLAVVIFGGFIVLNLFVAILLSRMGSEDEQKWALESSISLAHRLKAESKSKLKKNEADEPIETDASITFKRKRIVESLERRNFLKEENRKQMKARSNRDKREIEGTSLMIFSKDNAFRKFVHKLVINKAFDVFIDLLIIANCVFLMLENPRRVGDALFENANYVFTVIFILEMLFKIIALGMLPYPLFPENKWCLVTDEHSLQWCAYEYLVLDALTRISEKDLYVIEPLNLHKRGVITRINCCSNGVIIVEWRTLKTIRLVFRNKDLIGVYFLKERGMNISDFIEENKNVKSTEGISWHKWKMLLNVNEEIDKICRTHDMSNKAHNSYLSSKWNQLDAFVVLVSILGVLMPSNKMLRGVRGIRPLRIAVRIQPIKVILSALIRAVPGMLQVLVFCSSFWVVLAILGMEWFSGQFRSCFCQDEKMMYGDDYCPENGDPCITLKSLEDCAEAATYGECEWGDEIFNFNNVFQSIHTLFVLATMSGWNDIMYRGVDVTGMNLLPNENEHPIAAIYFVVIILVCAFFSLNLIISVVVDNFQRIKNEQDGSALMTEEQRKWVMTSRLVERLGLKKNLLPPAQHWRNTIFIIVMHPYFDPLIMACIVLNTLTMCVEYYGASIFYQNVLDGLDTFYIVVFTVEALVKIVGLGWRQYIGSSWNKFDFFIVLVGLVSLADVSGDASFNVLRLFRIGRVLRLINKAKTLRTHFLTLMYSIPSLWNIGLLIIVVFFVYAVVGMHLFGTEDAMDGWEFGDSEANFQDFQKAFIILFRVSSGDGWSDVYERYLSDVSDENLAWVYGYFISFFLVGALIMINLFIAVILDSFSEEQEALEREQELKTIKVWRAIWQEYDHKTTGTLPAEQFIEILKYVPSPVGFLDETAFKEQLRHREHLASTPVDLTTGGGILNNSKDGSLNAIKAEPGHRAILDLLIKLKLFVEKKTYGNREVWCVNYQDALLSYATMLVGPDLDVEPQSDDKQIRAAALWYADENDCMDLQIQVFREQAQEAKGREVARLMMDAYYQQPSSEGGVKSDFGNEREDSPKIIGVGESTDRPAIELQKR